MKRCSAATLGALCRSSRMCDARRLGSADVAARGALTRCNARIIRRSHDDDDKNTRGEVGRMRHGGEEGAHAMNALCNACVRAMLSGDNDANVDLQLQLEDMTEAAKGEEEDGDALLARSLLALLTNRAPDAGVLEALPPAHDVALRRVYAIVEDSGWKVEGEDEMRPPIADLSDELFQPPPTAAML